MLRQLMLLALLLAAFVVVQACPDPELDPGDDDDTGANDDDDTGTDDDDDTATGPVILEVFPEPGESDVFFRSEFWARFDVSPTVSEYSIEDDGGNDATGSFSADTSGQLITFTPNEPLQPETTYTVTIDWNSPSSPLSYQFSTSVYGTPPDDPNALVNRAYHLDLAAATFVEPAGIGAVLATQLADLVVMFEMTDQSDFDAGAQPGVHVLAANGLAAETVQDPCGETFPLTYGEDNIYGNTDDVPATWEFGGFDLGPTQLNLVIEGLVVNVKDALIAGTFHPDGTELAGGTLSGVLDTRGLSPVLDPNDPNAICALLTDVIGIPCEECGDPNPGLFCIDLLAEDILSPWIEDVDIQPISCVDILTEANDTGECAGSATVYDLDEDGVYEGCPDYIE